MERDDIDINAEDNLGKTLLLLAVEKGHEAVVRLLVERKDIDINTKDMKGWTPSYRQLRRGVRPLCGC